MPSHVEVVDSSNFDRIWLQFWTTRIQQLLKFYWKNRCFLGFRPFQLNLTTMRFRCPTSLHFGAKLGPKIWKNHFIRPSKTHRFFVLIILALIFMRFGLHLGNQVAAMLASCGPQNASKTNQKGKQKQSWAPKRPQDRFFMDFRWIFDWCLIDFGLIFDWFFGRKWGGEMGCSFC